MSFAENEDILVNKVNNAKYFNPDVSDIKTVAVLKHGNIAQIAKHYKVSRETVYQYLYRNEEGKKIIDEVRTYNTVSDLDMAEAVIRLSMMKHEEQPSIALRAAEKVIDKKGHLRGWSFDPSSEAVPKNEDSLTLGHENMMLRAQIAVLKEKHDNKSEAR